MCGIAGFYDFAGSSGGPSAELLAAMTSSLAHRGPDGEGAWLCPEQGVGLGNRRLAIVDRSARGAQPMASEDGSVRLTFNGEIYNHAELRADLEARGHRFRSRSDTEAIVHAYEEWGIDCFTRLLGMWALAIWDSARKRLVLSRDRVGVKPLYYRVADGRVWFASEVRALLLDPALRREVDFEALSQTLTFLVPPAPRTLFRGILKLPPASVLLVEAGGEPRLETFWDPLDADNPLVREAAGLAPERLERFAVETTRELLSRSVKRRMMADVPVGLFLSGGVDSSAIAALMRSHAAGPLDSFCVAYDEPGEPDEREHGRRVAQQFGFEHHEVVLGEQDLLDSLDGIVQHLDEPNGNWMSFPLYFLAREARRRGIAAILSGEGSDEIFGGYDGYLRAIRLSRYFESALWRLPGAKLVPWVLDPLVGATGRARGLLDEIERVTRGAPAFIGIQVPVAERLKRRILSVGESSEAGRWEQPSAAVRHYIARARAHRPRVAERPASRGERDAEALRWISYLELKHMLPEALLMRLDRMTMAHGVEGREPFLDHELVELVMALPGALRLRGGMTKYVLKRAVEPWLPHDIVHRRKVAFGAPVSRWLRGRLGERVAEQMAACGLVRDGVLRGDVVSALIRAHRGGADHAQEIWALYSVSRWHDAVLQPSDSMPPPSQYAGRFPPPSLTARGSRSSPPPSGSESAVLPPLPEGEGQGEGLRDAHMPPA